MTIPGPGVGEFFLGGFQNGEDAVEGFGAGELVAESCAGGEGFEEAFELAHAHGEVADGVVQVFLAFEGNDGVSLTDLFEVRMSLPRNHVSVPIDPGQFESILT